MASRKEQLNAYTFARKRTVAAFLQPSPAGSDEGAPRPLRTLLPGIVVGAVLLAGYGAWGLISPPVPQGWDEPGKHVIVADESTTRYVVIAENGKPILHPVLNMASARLLLDPGNYDVIKVKESVLDHSDLKRGATIGIPYAPDRLPSAEDAAKAKAWAVCDRPGGGTSSAPQQAVFVLGGDEAAVMDGKSKLAGKEVLYVQDQKNKTKYLVNQAGVKFKLQAVAKDGEPGDLDTLITTIFGNGAEPQTVTDAWLATLSTGTPIDFPPLAGAGTHTKFKVDGVSDANSTVGTVLEAAAGSGTQYYVITEKGPAPISEFGALLLLQESGKTAALHITNPSNKQPPFLPEDWPTKNPKRVNMTSGDSPRDVSCSVMHGGVTATGRPTPGVWAGKDFPEQIVEGTASAYVTPGNGLLYQEVTGGDVSGGTLYLVTDTGLRYPVSRNNDSTGANKASDSKQQANQAATRLGYEDVKPTSVPSVWSELLPKGPALDSPSAAQPQGS